MIAKQLETNVFTADDHATLVLVGDVNESAEQRLNEAYRAAADAHPASITLDFSAVEYINSTGIALIVGLLAAARGAKIPLHAVGLSDHYRELFEITRLSDFMTID